MKPNIVFIITDQQRFDTIAALGYDHMITPNLDRLVRGGTSFSNMYVTSPSCAPSRASLFSGVYPHTNGVMRNDEPWNYTWVPMLAGAGYHCVNVGKMHTNPFEKLLGFHERHVVENKDRDDPALPFYLDNWDKALWTRGIRKPSRMTYCERPDYSERLGAFIWELPEDLHPDNYVGNLAKMWLERYRGDEPFFLQIGLPGPHPPYDPTADTLRLYEDRNLPEAISDHDLDQQPEALRKLRQVHLDRDLDAVVHLEKPSRAQMRNQRAHYFANVTMIDTQVGEIIAALENWSFLDNTVIIFTSDHGDCLCDHGHSQKWTMYETSVKVPAVIYRPGLVAEDQRVDDLVSLFDFGPTILELAGLTPPDWMEARSLTPYFHSQSDPSRVHVFSEHAEDLILRDVGFMTMIREGDWKLVHFLDDDDGQLYNLKNDPEEIRNLWRDEGHAVEKQRLLGEILKWRLRSSKKTQGFVRELASG